MSTISRSVILAGISLITAFTVLPGRDPLMAQPTPALLEAGKPGGAPKTRGVRPWQARKARLRLDALNAPAFRLNLFDNAERFARRTRVEQTGPNKFVWEGQTDDGGVATFAIVDGVTTGTVFLDGRTFEIFPDGDGEYTVEELDPAAFPTEDMDVEPEFEEGEEADAGTFTPMAETAQAAADAAAPAEIAVMVLWTPAARAAQGGTSAIQSLILAAVNNANLAYSNSRVGARLKLVHSAELAFTESTTNIAGDLAALRSKTDGKADAIHALRDQHAADIVSLVGNGYAGKGYCGVGYQMASPSTAFAGNAFNIVDRTCAAGNLTLAHEIGHNQGLQHDPGNASSSGSYSYAYGYQDPGNKFRTVLSYGGATRVPYFSNPEVSYNGRATGTATQNNAKALNNTANIVAAFRGSAAAPSCSYAVSPGSLSFSSGAATATVSVTTSPGCGWSASSPASWAAVTGGGSGSGTATVTVTANGPSSRTATLTIAGKSVQVSQTALACSYTVTPATLSVGASGGSASVAVTTSEGCTWSATSPVAWASVSGGGNGSGSTTVSVASNNQTARTVTLSIAGKSVQLSQAAPDVAVAPTPPTEFSPIDLGCWKDGNPRDLPTRLANVSPAYDVGKALAMCKAKGAKYCGLQAGYAVFVGSAYGRYGAASSCGTFGGNMVNRVYQMKP